MSGNDNKKSGTGGNDSKSTKIYEQAKEAYERQFRQASNNAILGMFNESMLPNSRHGMTPNRMGEFGKSDKDYNEFTKGGKGGTYHLNLDYKEMYHSGLTTVGKKAYDEIASSQTNSLPSIVEKYINLAEDSLTVTQTLMAANKLLESRHYKGDPDVESSVQSISLIIDINYKKLDELYEGKSDILEGITNELKSIPTLTKPKIKSKAPKNPNFSSSDAKLAKPREGYANILPRFSNEYTITPHNEYYRINEEGEEITPTLSSFSSDSSQFLSTTPDSSSSSNTDAQEGENNKKRERDQYEDDADLARSLHNGDRRTRAPRKIFTADENAFNTPASKYNYGATPGIETPKSNSSNKKGKPKKN